MGLSIAQHRARIALCKAGVENGLCLYEVAEQCGVTPGGLSHWLNTNAKHLRVKLGENGRRQKRLRLTDDEVMKRLKLVIQLGQRGAAKRIGISDQAISQWLQHLAPDGAEMALLDYLPETE